MSDNGNVHRDPPPPITPHLVVDNSVTSYIRTDDGGTILCFTPIVMLGDQGALQPPQIRIEFSPDGWEIFRREVEADGVKSNIQISRGLPPGLPNQ